MERSGTIGGIIILIVYKIVAKRLKQKPETVTTFWYDENPQIQAWLNLMIKHKTLKPGQIEAKEMYTNDYNPLYKKQ